MNVNNFHEILRYLFQILATPLHIDDMLCYLHLSFRALTRFTAFDIVRGISALKSNFRVVLLPFSNSLPTNLSTTVSIQMIGSVHIHSKIA